MRTIGALLIGLTLTTGAWACNNYESCIKEAEGWSVLVSPESIQALSLQAIAYKLGEKDKCE